MNSVEYLHASQIPVMLLNIALALKLSYVKIPFFEAIPLLFILPIMNILIAKFFFKD